MMFPTAFCLALCALCLGGAAACAALVCWGTFRGRGAPQARVSVGCTFLSVCIAALAVYLIFFRTDGSAFAREDSVFLAAFFAAGALVSAFWKFLAVPLVLVYAGVLWYTNSCLSRDFSDAVRPVPVTVQESSVRVGDSSVQVGVGENPVILVSVCRLPERFVLPVPRFYYRFTVVPFADFLDGNVERAAPSAVPSKFRAWLLGNVGYAAVPIPEVTQFPALFSLRVESGLYDYDLRLSRDL